MSKEEKDDSAAGNKINVLKCQSCETALAQNSVFYTFAKNSYMFGFFCCLDCASASYYASYLKKAVVLKVNATAESHRNLVIVPTLQVLKQFKEESEKRELRRKYFS